MDCTAKVPRHFPESSQFDPLGWRALEISCSGVAYNWWCLSLRVLVWMALNSRDPNSLPGWTRPKQPQLIMYHYLPLPQKMKNTLGTQEVNSEKKKTKKGRKTNNGIHGDSFETSDTPRKPSTRATGSSELRARWPGRCAAPGAAEAAPAPSRGRTRPWPAPR